jgi:predicted glycoside hydrolase/deacetylase ChbG (UPF0249 family)
MFIQHVGYLPNHVDGHQHIHVLPGIRDVVAQVMTSYPLHQIRIPSESQLGHWFNGNSDFYNKVFEDSKTAMAIYRKYNIRLAILGLACVRTHCAPIFLNGRIEK